MKNRGITLVSLVITIIILIILAGISLNLVLGENGLFAMAKKAKENMELAQVEEQEQLNALYTQLESEISGDGSETGGTSYDIIAKLVEFKKAIADYIEEAGGEKPEYTAEKEEYGEAINGIVTNVTKDATATKEQILLGRTAWVNGTKVTGSMKNNGALNPNALNAGDSYTIPEGYTSGGKVTAKDLASQTQGDATEEDIAEGKTAWVKGEKITGSAKTRLPASSVIFKPGPGPWDFSEEFPEGIGFDINNCVPIIETLTSITILPPTREAGPCSVSLSAPKATGKFNSVSANISRYTLSSSDLNYGWGNSGGNITYKGCIYINSMQ